MKPRMLRFLLILLFFISFNTSLFCQDANYWSSSYYAGAFFTPGAVIARNNDSGVLFINPALLAFGKLNAVSVTGTIYQMESFRIRDAVGKNLDLKGGGTSVSPLIASNSITFNKKKKPITVFYALVNTPVIDFDASQRKDGKFQVLDDSYSPGTEYFVGQFTYQNKVSETGFLLSSGIPISKDFSVGVSLEGGMRKQFFRQDFSARSLMNGSSDPLFPPVVHSTQSYQNSYRSIGSKVKLGFAYDLNEKHHFGLLLTSPVMRLMGTATIVSDITVNNIMLGNVNVRLLGSTRQAKLKAKWRSPVSTAAGYSYHHQKGQVYVAVEYFAKLKEYNVVQPRNEVFVRPDTIGAVSASSILKMKDARKAVLNVALGTSYEINPRLTGYFSLRTDFSYADRALFSDTDGFAANTSVWDNYHCQIGANIIRKRFSLRAGFLLSYGMSNDFQQPINFDNPNESNLMTGEISYTKASHLLGSVLISYIHNL